jgi:hypothetical protein
MGALALALCLPGVAVGCGVGSDLPAVSAGRTPARLLGNWRENFESRPGCSDTTTIFDDQGALGARGVNCEDKTPYVFRNLRYTGTSLVLELDVPKSSSRVVYTFKWLTENDLAGEAVVTGPKDTKTHPVRWTRLR